MSTEERLEKLYESYQFLIDKHIELKRNYINLQQENIILIRKNEALVNESTLTRYIAYLEKKLVGAGLMFKDCRLILGNWIRGEAFYQLQSENKYLKEKNNHLHNKLHQCYGKKNLHSQGQDQGQEKERGQIA